MPHLEEQLIVCKDLARIRSQTLAEWTEPIPLPLFYNEEYRFEIFEEHQFGFNPEEFAVAVGKIEVTESDTFCTWEVTS